MNIKVVGQLRGAGLSAETIIKLSSGFDPEPPFLGTAYLRIASALKHLWISFVDK
jgi:hypothetical protein